MTTHGRRCSALVKKVYPEPACVWHLQRHIQFKLFFVGLNLFVGQNGINKVSCRLLVNRLITQGGHFAFDINHRWGANRDKQVRSLLINHFYKIFR